MALEGERAPQARVAAESAPARADLAHAEEVGELREVREYLDEKVVLDAVEGGADAGAAFWDNVASRDGAGAQAARGWGVVGRRAFWFEAAKRREKA